MRINPISMTYNRQNLRPQNQNNKQNVSFGRFADDTARRMAYEYLKVDKGDSWDRAAFDYLDETPFVTIKSAKNKAGDTFIYSVAERSAIDKHENKNLFYEMLNDLYKGSERLRMNKDAREAGVTSEPGFLTIEDDFTGLYNLYENFCDCEEGYYGKRGSSSSSSDIEYAEKTPYEQGYEDSLYMRR